MTETTQRKKKVALTGMVRIPESISREIDIEAARQGIFKYELMLAAWDCYKLQQSGSTTEK